MKYAVADLPIIPSVRFTRLNSVAFLETPIPYQVDMDAEALVLERVTYYSTNDWTPVGVTDNPPDKNRLGVVSVGVMFESSDDTRVWAHCPAEHIEKPAKLTTPGRCNG